MMKTGITTKKYGHIRYTSITGAFTLLYFFLYLVYLWFNQEGEIAHWISLVMVPFIFILIGSYIYEGRISVRNALASVGLRRDNARQGIMLGILFGLCFSLMQLIISDHRQQIWQIITSGQVILYLPITILLILFTAGFTEEFFFRGVLQTRLAKWWKNEVIALLVTSVLFGVYHVPYLYFNSPLSGNVPSILGECSLLTISGLFLGFVYLKSEKNLLASVAMHTLFDAFPAMTMLHFTGHIG